MSTCTRDWTPTASELPPEGEVVETMAEGGKVQLLVHKHGLWFLPGMSMYVYCTPKYWRKPMSADNRTRKPDDPFVGDPKVTTDGSGQPQNDQIAAAIEAERTADRQIIAFQLGQLRTWLQRMSELAAGDCTTTSDVRLGHIGGLTEDSLTVVACITDMLGLPEQT